MDSSLQDGPEPPVLLPARMLNEFAYCPRLFYLEWVQREWEDSADTVEGRHLHRRVDKASGPLPTAEAAGFAEGAQEAFRVRSVLLESERLRLVARIDLVEGDEGQAVPVDYKHGSVPPTPEQSWEPDRVQLCAQGLLLREHGFKCDHGVLYYVASRRRVVIPFTPDLIRRTLALRDQAFEIARSPTPPPPLVDSPKCPRCSLVGICLPDETLFLQDPSVTDPHNAVRDKESAEPAEDRVRRLFPARPDALPVYVQRQGAHVRLSGERLLVTYGQETLDEIRLLDVSQLCLFGHVHLSAQALKEVASRGIPICHLSTGGWLSALTLGLTHRNVELRRRQFRAADDETTCLDLARRFVAAKIVNCRTLLRRNHTSRPADVLTALSHLASEARHATRLESLLGIEGTAARLYFSAFSGMIKGKQRLAFDVQGRNRRPPRDPVNALLSYAYALLTKDFVTTLLSVGFDPYLGFFHQPKWGKPALALDLMEEFRPIIADSTVITAINNGEVTADDFVVHSAGVALTDEGRRRFIQTYERRLDTLVQHPVFGYSTSYRRVFEVQARLLARYLFGEISHYPAFLTR
jgi:CRISPR-associated protein Cas1